MIEPITDADLFPPLDSPNSYKHRVGHPDQSLLYRPGRWFHDHDVEVTYRRDVARDPLRDVAMIHGTLPMTQARLNAGEPLTLGISGDSISTGLDASVMKAATPFQPGYPELVVAQLQVLFDSDISLKNRAVSGWSVANGVADLDALLAEKPNLIIVAYGMNDVGRRDPKWFAEQTRIIIDRTKAANADIEIILVSPMLGNSEWIHTPREMFSLYRDELKSLVSPGVALADVTAVWTVLLQRKHDLDLTGNGLNHPNDFGHRLYAQTVLQLMSPDRSADLWGFSPKPEAQLIATFKTKGEALALSKGLDRDRAVDESGNQVAVFGRRGSRPFNLEEMRKLYIRNGQLYTVINGAPGPPVSEGSAK